MSKITKKMIDNYSSTKKIVEESKKSHQKNIDKIIEIIKPYIAEKYKNDKVHWDIDGIDFCNDSGMKGKPIEYEWIEISEKEYWKIIEQEKWDRFHNKNFKSKVKEDYVFDPELDIKYYQEVEKKYEYLRVYVSESWGYGGNDTETYDFLIIDIMDEKDLRKEKLLKLEEISND